MKADDLAGKNVTVEIDEVTFEEIGTGRDKENKIILSFKGKDKKMILNKTNATAIAKVLGTEETDEWSGNRIILTTREVDFQGTPTLAIRVSLQKPASAQARQPAKTEPEPADQDGDNNDDPGF